MAPVGRVMRLLRPPTWLVRSAHGMLPTAPSYFDIAIHSSDDRPTRQPSSTATENSPRGRVDTSRGGTNSIAMQANANLKLLTSLGGETKLRRLEVLDESLPD